MRAFEVGDKVRLKEQGKHSGRYDGDKVVCTVYDQNCICISSNDEVIGVGGFNAFDLEFIEGRPTTDEEIAAQYRQARLDVHRLCNELWGRGFSVRLGDGLVSPPISPRLPLKDAKITKTITTVQEI